MEQLLPYHKDFHEIWYRRIFQKPITIIQVLLKSDKNNGTLCKDLRTFTSISLTLTLLRIRNVLDKEAEKIKTHILCSITFFPKIKPFMRYGGKMSYSQTSQKQQYNTKHTYCMLANLRPQKHSEYVKYISVPWQQLLRKRASMLHYTYLAYSVMYAVWNSATVRKLISIYTWSPIISSATAGPKSELKFKWMWQVFKPVHQCNFIN